LPYNTWAGQFKETDGEGITHITVVGDIASAVLAYSVVSAYFVAFCVAFVDSVSYRGYCRGGVYCPAQGHPLFTREITRPSLTRQAYSVQRTGRELKILNPKQIPITKIPMFKKQGNLQIIDNECKIVNRSGESSSVG